MHCTVSHSFTSNGGILEFCSARQVKTFLETYSATSLDGSSSLDKEIDGDAGLRGTLRVLQQERVALQTKVKNLELLTKKLNVQCET